MNKRELSQPHSSENADGNTRKDRYYVQSLTDRIFLVRECLSGAAPGPDDHIVRSFDVYHDAHSYASSMNIKPHDKPDSPAAPGPNSLAE